MSKDSVSVLNELIQITKDSEEGFHTAAHNVEDSSLKDVFMKKAQNCQNVISELQGKVRELNGNPEENGSLLGAMHRGWTSIKATLTGKDSQGILNECERGEDVIKAAYKKALESDLAPDVRALVQKHNEKVVSDHDHIRDLRDQYAAKAEAR